MKVLVVSPHPDDETLGAGGTLLKFKNEGNKIYWLNFTNMSEKNGYAAYMVKTREDEIRKVSKIFSFDGFYDFGLKPCFLSECSKRDIIDKATNVLGEIKPAVVIVPFKNDVHSDHRTVFEIVYSCTKAFRAAFITEVLMMEILSETEFASSDNGFVPNYFIDISNYLDKKITIMRTYKKELGDHPFPRSAVNIRALATYRGATAGCQFAESFMLLKKIA